jgi:hypothetical protein
LPYISSITTIPVTLKMQSAAVMVTILTVIDSALSHRMGMGLVDLAVFVMERAVAAEEAVAEGEEDESRHGDVSTE